MPRLSLTLCGPTKVRLDDAPLGGSSLGAKPLALLAFLAIERGGHARDALAALLWGEFPEAQARASLRQALAQLRRVLGDALAVDHGSVHLDADAALDVAPLLGRAPPATASVDDVAALDPGRFLDGVHVRHGGAFEEWAESLRARMLRRQAELLADATRDALARLDWARAAALADRWRAAAPLDADAVRAAMESRHLLGRTGDALALYAAHRALLMVEVGEPPPPALRELAQRLTHARDAATASTTPAGGVAAVGHLAACAPLLGRAREWAALGDAWRAAREGAGTVAVVSGELGAGKSRLLADFARRVEGDGGVVLRARARESTAAVPFATAAELLRSALDAPGFAATGGEWLAEVARLVPEVRTRLPGVPLAPRAAASDEWRLYEGAAQLVATLAAEQPLCVIVDDAHWCDAESATLLRMLVERGEGTPALWLVALGTGAAPRDAAGMRLAGALAALPDATALALAPFGEPEIRALLAAAGGMADDARTRALAARLHAETDGVPWYVLEAVRALRARELLGAGEDGRWVVTPALAASTELVAALDTPALAAPLTARIERLGDDARSVLLTLAVARDACAPELLSAVHGISRLRAAAIGDALVERALAREEDGRYRVTNLIVASVVRARGSSARRHEVERALRRARDGADARPSSGVSAAELPRASGEWRVSV